MAFEPECAALYCQQITSDMVAEYSDPPSNTSKCSMVLDVGEYNVEVCIYEAQVDSTIKSVLPPTGNDCGGATVNREFSCLLQRMVGDDEFSSLCNSPGNEASNKAVITDLVNLNFEGRKENFCEQTEDDEGFMAFIRLDSSLLEFYERGLTTATARRCGIHLAEDILLSFLIPKWKSYFNQQSVVFSVA